MRKKFKFLDEDQEELIQGGSKSDSGRSSKSSSVDEDNKDDPIFFGLAKGHSKEEKDEEMKSSSNPILDANNSNLISDSGSIEQHHADFEKKRAKLLGNFDKLDVNFLEEEDEVPPDFLA